MRSAYHQALRAGWTLTAASSCLQPGHYLVETRPKAAQTSDVTAIRPPAFVKRSLALLLCCWPHTIMCNQAPPNSTHHACGCFETAGAAAHSFFSRFWSAGAGGGAAPVVGLQSKMRSLIKFHIASVASADVLRGMHMHAETVICQASGTVCHAPHENLDKRQAA